MARSARGGIAVHSSLVVGFVAGLAGVAEGSTGQPLILGKTYRWP